MKSADRYLDFISACPAPQTKYKNLFFLHSRGKTEERVGRKEMGRERGMTEKVGYSMLLWVAVDEALNLTKLAEIKIGLCIGAFTPVSYRNSIIGTSQLNFPMTVLGRTIYLLINVRQNN